MPNRLLVGVLASVLAGTLAATALAVTSPSLRTFEFSYTAEVQEIPEGTRKVDVWLPQPVSDEYQDVESLGVDSPVAGTLTQDPDYKNSMLHFVISNPQASSIKITQTFRVRRREHLKYGFKAVNNSLSVKNDPELERWLQPERLVPIDDRIRALAAEVTTGRETNLEKISAIYDYVTSVMTYEKKGTGWGRGDIYYACDYKRGNCTDFHALVIGLARAVEIPAKFVIGFPIPEGRHEGQVSGYHCWAEFYLAGFGWVPVDASEANKNPEKKDYFFGGLCQNRVQFGVGRDITLTPRQRGHELNFFIYPYVEVDGAQYRAVERTFHYRDLDQGESPSR